MACAVPGGEITLLDVPHRGSRVSPCHRTARSAYKLRSPWEFILTTEQVNDHLWGDHIGFRNQMEPFRRIGSQLLQFSRETTQRKKNVAGFVPPAQLWEARNLRLEAAQITHLGYAISAPLALTKEVGSVSEFRHKIDFRTTIAAPVARHLANGQAEPLLGVALEPRGADFLEDRAAHVFR